jgi:hypothetical protein
VLEILVGPTAAYELIGRPLDMQAIVDAVKRVVGIADKTALRNSLHFPDS